MLLEFSAANYRSINSKCILSMLAQGISDKPVCNIIKVNRTKILKTIAIYGANSSGKTNIVKAMLEMAKTVLASVKLNDNEELQYDPYLLTTNIKKPSCFEVIFLIEDIKYRYGFELTNKSIVGEWLFKSKVGSKTEKTLFIRSKNGIGVDSDNFAEGEGKEVGCPVRCSQNILSNGM